MTLNVDLDLDLPKVNSDICGTDAEQSEHLCQIGCKWDLASFREITTNMKNEQTSKHSWRGRWKWRTWKCRTCKGKAEN